MLKANRTFLILLLLFAFSFIYRAVLMLLDTFPPGADIGLHNSVIYSITGHGNVDFFYNSFHMGSGLSLTFPGYHIFTSAVMLMTGLPDYLAHTMVVSLFSALIVLVAFLITRKVWSEPAAYIVAFLAAISRFDVEMLMWGGYPNVITLLLIPLTFYLYLQRERFSTVPFLASTSLLAGSIFLTHSLSAAVFLAITFVMVLLMLIIPKRLGTTRKTGIYWLLPIIFGAILFAPFIIDAVPAYLNNNSTLASPASQNAIDQATVLTQTLPLNLVLPLFGAFAGLLIFSKKYIGRFVALPTFLLSLWLFIPLVLTQSYLVGIAVDYNRFLYFLILPLIIFIAVLIEHGSRFFAGVAHNYLTWSSQANQNVKTRYANFSKVLTRKRIYSGFVLFFLLFSFLALPIFMGPVYNGGQVIQQFYQTMDSQAYEAIQWAKTNTAKNAVFVSDALYGWWLGGFAQRRTYSAVDPQYLSINEEYDKALFARTLMDTDYLVDNGWIQVREDGGYIARQNPAILATLNWTYFPYEFFNFASNNTKITYILDVSPKPILQSISVNQLSFKGMRMQNDSQQAIITVVRGNEYLNYTQQTTINRGSRFVNLTTTIESANPSVLLELLDIDLQSYGIQIPYNNDHTIAFLAEDVKVLGQLIFTENKPTNTTVGSHHTELQYYLEGKQQQEIQITATAYAVTDNLSVYNDPVKRNDFLNSQVSQNMNQNQPLDNTKDWTQVFNYQKELQRYNVSYVVCRYPDMFPKYLEDPTFSVVYMNSAESSKLINNQIAIFKVDGNLN